MWPRIKKESLANIVRTKTKICLFPVTCPNTKVRVGRWAFFVVAKRDFA